MLNAQESSTSPKYDNGKRTGVGFFFTIPTKNPKLSVNTEIVVDKNAENSFDDMDSLGDNAPTIFYDNDIDFGNCNLTEVIKFLQKLAKTPNASKMNLAFTKHITNALIEVREEKLKCEFSIPRKLENLPLI